MRLVLVQFSALSATYEPFSHLLCPRSYSGGVLHHLDTLIGALALAAALVAPARAQNATPVEPATPQAPAAEPWREVTFGATLEAYYQYNANTPPDRISLLRAYDTRALVRDLEQVPMREIHYRGTEVRSATVQVVPLSDGDGSDM